MKSLIATICILGLVGMVVGAAVKAGDEASVAATVTVQNISVSVTDGSVTYGTLPVNTTKSTLAGELNDLQTATNNGNITENFNIKGQDSSGGWTLAVSAGDEQYMHEFSKTASFPGTALTTGYQTLATAIDAAGTQTFDLQITTPTATADYDQQSVNVTVQAVSGL